MEKFGIPPFQTIDLCTDYLFKEVGCDNEIIQEIARVVLGKNVEVIHCEAEKKYSSGVDSGTISCDVLGENVGNELIDLEMQRKITKDLWERSQVYISVLIAQSNPKGKNGNLEKDYRDCPNCYSIWFTLGDAFKTEEPVTYIEYREKDGKVNASSKGTIVFCNIQRWSEMDGDMSKLCHYLLETTPEVYLQSKCHVVELLHQRVEEIKQRKGDELKYMKHECEIEEAKWEAAAEGRAEGKLQATEEIILNMKTKNYPNSSIADMVNVPLVEVERVLRKNNIA